MVERKTRSPDHQISAFTLISGRKLYYGRDHEAGWITEGWTTMAEPETQDEPTKAPPDRRVSQSGGKDTEITLLKFEVSYIEFEERFINYRIVLIILAGIASVAIAGTVGVFAYLHYVPKDLQTFLSMVTLGLGGGFFWVVPGIITAKSGMRKVRKLQEILRTAIANEQARGACD